MTVFIIMIIVYILLLKSHNNFKSVISLKAQSIDVKTLHNLVLGLF